MTGSARWPVLVTGASSGIGLETALHLAERGFLVCATMRDLHRRDELDAEVARRRVSLQVEALDVTDAASVDAVVRGLAQRYGGIRGVVNNAGIQVRGYFEDLSDNEIREVFDVNLFGTMAVVRSVLPSMRAARQGRIVIVSSVGGLLGSPALSAYCSSKHGLEGFAESLSLEVAGLGVQVSIVEPAIVRTAIWGKNKRIARAARENHGVYHQWFQNEERFSDKLVVEARTTATDVARAVGRALSAHRPRLRYVVGRQVSALLLLRRYIPAAMFERLYFGEVIRRVTGARA
jgi:NAD(P)-dependent dehydrogenase (short-subunit alcohol dehydrogenase family)